MTKWKVKKATGYLNSGEWWVYGETTGGRWYYTQVESFGVIHGE